MSKWNVRIGINPIGWSNDDLPSLGGDTPLETALSEGAEIGYQGFELGNKFPKTPQGLKDKLAEFNVACVSGWYSARLADLANWSVEQEIAQCKEHMAKLQFNGCKVVVYGEVANSVQGQIDTPVSKRPIFTTKEQWQEYANRLNAFGDHIKSQYGLTLAYHHHMGAYVESAADVEILMSLTDKDKVGLLFDTGHCWFANADRNTEHVDVLSVLRKHLDRVVHVHCKDIRADVIRNMRNQDASFLHSVLSGAFTVPGDGAVNFGEVLSVLHQAGYEGWLVVEAEQDPAIAPSYEYGKKGFDTLNAIVTKLGA